MTARWTRLILQRRVLVDFSEGEHFVSGGEDKVLRVWDYDEGISYFKGIGHPGAITKVRGKVTTLG